MPANQPVETRSGKKVGKEREAVSLQKGAPKRSQVYNFSKKGHWVINNMDIIKKIVALQKWQRTLESGVGAKTFCFL